MVGMALGCGPAIAQMHKVEKPQQVVRAVGVYEWTGDLAKPKASRLVPVTLFINGEFQDAGVYMPQPVPFALDSGNVYELKQAGADKGTVTLEYARHLQTANGDYEDSWMGYGSFKAPAPPKPVIARHSSGPMPQVASSVKDSVDPDRPVLLRRAGSESTDDAPAPSAPSAAPAAKRTAAAQLPAGENNPADDPDRPILKRPANESASNAGSDSTKSSSTGPATTSAPGSPPETPTAGSSPESDPNRPTLKRGRSNQGPFGSQPDAAGMDASLNSDPNRPILRPGGPAGETTGGNLPKLIGMPDDMHQMVAVSDAVNREPHVFTREWEDPTEEIAIRAKIEAIAQAKLAAYAKENALESERATAIHTSAKRTTAARRRTKATVAPAEALMDESLKGYTLSYGGDPTFVYTAHTAGTGSAQRLVTVVAQTDETGELRPVLTSVTDADHLDRTPEMKFIDVVDADASNRASLLFELKEQSTRQFALYRVYAGQSQQVFLSGTTQ